MNKTIQKSLRNFIIGKNRYIDSDAEFKRVLLLGQTALSIFFLSLIMIVYGVIIENYSGIILFIIASFLSIGVFLLNKTNKSSLAKVILLIFGNFLVFLFMQKDPLGTGSYLYLIPCFTGALAFFSFQEKSKWLSFIGLSSFIFIINQIVDVDIIQKASFTPLQENIYFNINFFGAATLTVLMIYFLMRTNNSIEADLRQNQQLLKESEEKFRLAVYGVDAGIWDWPDMNNSYLWWSPKCYELLGYDFDEIPAHKTSFWSLLIHPDDTQRLNAALFEHFRKRKNFNVRIRLKTKEKGYRWFLCSGQALWDQDGKPIRMVGSIINMDEHIRREEKIREQNSMLEKANKELDRFVYSASHDLRAPLSSILGLINLALKEEERSEINKMMDLMKGRVENLNSFINEIIDYSKNTRQEVKQDTISLAQLVDECIQNSAFRDGFSTIEIINKIEPNFQITSDPSRLKVVINNLIDNAIKYHDRSKKKQYIEIGVQKKREAMEIFVKDNGRGINTELQEKVFNMFYRASEDSKGSGLGLYIVKETIEKIGGRIHLKSTHKEGSTFIISLPITSADVLQNTLLN